MKKTLLPLGLIALFLNLNLSSCNQVSKQSQETTKSSNISNIDERNEIVGQWKLSNPEKNVSINLTFNSNGSFEMNGRDASFNQKNISGSWSKTGDKIYLTTPGESEVGVFEILSFDNNSLVIHIKGEPDKEIMYFKRS